MGLRSCVELKARDELLGERAARAFGENHDLRLQIVARFEIRFRLVLLIDALVVGAHAGHLAAFEQEFAAGKALKDGDARSPRPWSRAI